MKIFIICCLLFIHVNMCIYIRGFRVSIRVSGIRSGFGYPRVWFWWWISTRIGFQGGFGFRFRVSVLGARRLHPIRTRPVAILTQTYEPKTLLEIPATLLQFAIERSDWITTLESCSKDWETNVTGLDGVSSTKQSLGGWRASYSSFLIISSTEAPNSWSNIGLHLLRNLATHRISAFSPVHLRPWKQILLWKFQRPQRAAEEIILWHKCFY